MDADDPQRLLVQLDAEHAGRCGAACLVSRDGGRTYMHATSAATADRPFEYALSAPRGEDGSVGRSKMLRCDGLVGTSVPAAALPLFGERSASAPRDLAVCEPFGLAAMVGQRREHLA